jgi:Xaa-Pro aminopeptidase
MTSNRIQNIRKALGKNFDALLISSIPNIIYLTNFNGFSNEEREAYLLLTKKQNYIFTDSRYFEVANKIAGFKLIEISSDKNFVQALKEIVNKESIKKIAIDEDNLKISEVIKIKKIVKIYPDESLIENLRIFKDESEIKEIKKACNLGDKTFKYILTKIKLGITEKELAKKIEIFILENNAGISFRPIVAFNENSSSPHHVASNRKLKKNEIVLLDFGVKTEGNYCSDMTRTVFFGKATTEFKNIYQTVLIAQSKAIKHLKSSIINPAKGEARQRRHKSVTGFDTDKIAREHIKSKGYPTIPHSLGHGIGQEVHEKPSLSSKSKDILQAGMVFSIEPGIYLPEFGGVRIEDLVFLDKNGPKIITSANRELIEL